MPKTKNELALHTCGCQQPPIPIPKTFVDTCISHAIKSISCCSVKEAAHALGCSAANIRAHIKQGNIKAFYLGATLRIRATRLVEFQEKQEKAFRARRFSMSERGHNVRDAAGESPLVKARRRSGEMRALRKKFKQDMSLPPSTPIDAIGESPMLTPKQT